MLTYVWFFWSVVFFTVQYFMFKTQTPRQGSIQCSAGKNSRVATDYSTFTHFYTSNDTSSNMLSNRVFLGVLLTHSATLLTHLQLYMQSIMLICLLCKRWSSLHQIKLLYTKVWLNWEGALLFEPSEACWWRCAAPPRMKTWSLFFCPPSVRLHSDETFLSLFRGVCPRSSVRFLLFVL